MDEGAWDVDASTVFGWIVDGGCGQGEVVVVDFDQVADGLYDG